MKRRDLLVTSLGLVFLFLSSCATTESGKSADRASTMDYASTGVALTTVQGATELNPLALPLMPLRYAMSRSLDKRPCVERRSGHAMMSAVSYGAFGNNLLLLAGVGFPPLGLLAAIPAYRMVKRQACIPTLTNEDILLLAKWRDGYQRGDIEALRVISANEGMMSDYAGLFATTQGRAVVYKNLESVKGGFFATYQVTFRYKDGSEVKREGSLEFTVKEGKIVDVV
jgi:hypothetical protein